jgi:ribulose kinase
VVAAQADGAPVHPALLWMDIRAQAEAREFTLTKHRALDVCPDGVSPEWGPPKALWLQRNLPDAYAAADVLCEGGDWLIHRLTGAWTVNLPAAVTAWFYDAQAERWPADLYQAAGCRDLAKRLPRAVLAPGTVAGPLRAEIAAELGLPPGIPVVAGGIDSVSAMLGSGAGAPGVAALITGSSNVVLAQVSTPVRSPGIWGSYLNAGLPGYELVVGLHSAGSALAWMRRELLSGVHDFAELEREAEGILAGAEGLIFLPDMQGNRTPFTEPRARGVLWGLTLSHRAPHLYRAMLEGVAYATRLCIESMETSGVQIASIRACGGGSRSSGSMQIYADVLGRPLTTAATSDASALGAAIAAATGAGLYADLAAAMAGMTSTGPTFRPNVGVRARYDRSYALFKRTYEAMLPLMRDAADHDEEA